MVVGVGKTQVTIYEDYRCPVCKNVHDKIQPALNAALAASSVKVEFHAVNLIDHASGGKGSLAAANAASCAFKAGKFQSYREALFAAQPNENDDAYAQPDKLIDVAKGVNGLDGPAFEDCVKNQPYAASIQSTYDATLGASKFNGVPAIFINGKQWQVPTSGDLAAAFTDAIKAG
ncbi:hypothetical protein GCM10009838_40940 [Catenulispora subtropica]|uniref:Thioredoxin-like fold domain-containing protein n=1 Tax=Catenulispora subtropica TaxID=450798 RepID=A0ABP5DCN1_9ACTN